MNVQAAVFNVSDDAGALPVAPIFDCLARKECYPRRNKVIEEQISRAGPGALAFGTYEMNCKVGNLCQEHKRPRPCVANSMADKRAREFVEQRIPPRGLIDGEIHLAAGLQHAKVLLKSRERIFRVMNYPVRNHQVRTAILKGQMQVIGDDARPLVAFHREIQRNAAAIESNASNSALREKAEHAPGPAT